MNNNRQQPSSKHRKSPLDKQKPLLFSQRETKDSQEDCITRDRQAKDQNRRRTRSHSTKQQSRRDDNVSCPEQNNNGLSLSTKPDKTGEHRAPDAQEERVGRTEQEADHSPASPGVRRNPGGRVDIVLKSKQNSTLYAK